MSKKCLWCANRTAQLNKVELKYKEKSKEVEICSPECEKKLRAFMEYANSHIKHYLAGLFLSLVIGFGVVMLQIHNGGFGTFLIFAGMGATLIKYPFVTPQTIKLLGAKKAIATGKILGVTNIIIGVIFWIILANA